MNTATATRVPLLYCPIQSAIHAKAYDINAAGLNWISKFNLFGGQSRWERYVSANPGMLPARVMPHAPMGPALQAAANLLFWLWAFDDLECDETVTGQCADDLVIQLCSLARAGEAPVGLCSANPFIAALADLRRQLEQVATAVQVARWSSAMQAYFLANTAVAIQNSRGVVPDLDTCVGLRVHSGAVKPTLMLLDVAEGYELPASQLCRPLGDERPRPFEPDELPHIAGLIESAGAREWTDRQAAGEFTTAVESLVAANCEPDGPVALCEVAGLARDR